jgi:hypothetical protein
MKIKLLVPLLLISCPPLLGQGCSDSGFCTMGALKPDPIIATNTKVRVHSIEFTQHYGRTAQGDQIYSAFTDVVFSFLKKTNLQVRLPAYTYITGKMPSTAGWGDYFFNFSHLLVQKPKYHILLTAGSKIYNRAQQQIASNAGAEMPLYQQTSIPTDDIVFGVSIINRKWTVATAYRRPISHRSGGFHHGAWQDSPIYDVALQYAPSNGLQPGDDLMFRLERNFRFSRFNLYAGVLNLYRLQPDRVLRDEHNYAYVNGSAGLASNLVTGLRYRFDVKHSIKLLTSTRLIERKANPDGLARTFIGQVAYEFRF